MTTYAALIYNPADLKAHEDPEIAAEYKRFIEEASAAGVLRGGHPLAGTETATTVSFPAGKPAGKPSVTDGPYAETKEILAGFFLIACADLEEAIRWAQRIPGAWHGRVEVRPVVGGEG